MPSAAPKRPRGGPQAYPAFVQMLRAEGVASPERVRRIFEAFDASAPSALTPVHEHAAKLAKRLSVLHAAYLPHKIVAQLLSGLLAKYEAPAPAPGVDLLARYSLTVDGVDVDLGGGDDDATAVVELLLLRRVVSLPLKIGGETYDLFVHFEEVAQDLPAVYAQRRSDKRRFVVKRRDDHRTHAHLLAHYPQWPGLVVRASVVQGWGRAWADADAAHDHGDAAFAVHRCDVLERLSALWLSRPPRVPSRSTLHVNALDARTLLDCLVQNDGIRCHFMCIGGGGAASGVLRAYLCLHKTSSLDSEVFRMHVGSVAL